MIELPDFVPLKTVDSIRPLSRSTLDAHDHVLVVVGKSARGLERLPYGRQLATLLARAERHGEHVATSRATNRRSTGLTVARFDAAAAFAALSWSAKIARECMRDQPESVAVAFVALDEATGRRAAEALLAAFHAAAFRLPTFKSKLDTAGRPTRLRLVGTPQRVDHERSRAEALGNNVARWLTALPPNVLTAEAYRAAAKDLAAAHDIRYRFLGETELEALGAGAFLAVSRGNATRDAGIVHLSYRPRAKRPALTQFGRAHV